MGGNKTRRTADVVVPVHSNVEMTRECLESVLALSPSLGHLIVVDDCGPDRDMATMVDILRVRDSRVRLLNNEQNLGFVRSVNRGLSIRQGDAVVLNSDTRVTKGWLDELMGVAAEVDRIAAVTPLSNNATFCSVPTYMEAGPVESLEMHQLSLEGLPRFTIMPTGIGFCLFLKDVALNAIGLLDPAYGRGYNEENDWCARARRGGFVVARANRALVFHYGGASFGAEAAALDRQNAKLLVYRYPAYLEENHEFDVSLDARIAAHGVAAQMSRPKVCIQGLHPSLTEAIRADGRVEVSSPEQGAQIVHRHLPETHAALVELLALPCHAVVSIDNTSRLSIGSEAESFGDSSVRRTCGLAAVQSAQAVIVPSSRDRRDLVELNGVSSGTLHVVAPGVSVLREPANGSGPIVAQVGAAQLASVLAGYAQFRTRVRESPELVLINPPPSHDWPAGVRAASAMAFKDAGIVLLPSAFGDARTALEAIASGRPTIISTLSPGAELCAGGAVVLQTLSAGEIADALATLWQSPDHGASRGEAGRVHAAAFGFEVAAKSTVDVYMALLATVDRHSISQRRLISNLLSVHS